MLEQGHPDVLVKIIQLLLEGVDVYCGVDGRVDQCCVVLDRLLIQAAKFAQDGARLRPIVLLANFEALLGRVEVLLEVCFDLRDDRVRLQLAGQL